MHYGRRTNSKNPMGMIPYKMFYGKSCHLPLELEHEAYWAIRYLNLDLKYLGEKRLLDMNAPGELRNDAYENTRIYKVYRKSGMIGEFTRGSLT